MSESLTRSYDSARSTLASDAAEIPRRRPNETESEYAERLSTWRSMNVVQKAASKLERFGE